MLKLVIAVAAIGLPDSLNPSLIAGALYYAAGREPARHTAAFTAGAFLTTLAGGAVIALGLGHLVLSLLPELSSDTKDSLLVAGGAVLIVGGTAIWVRRDALVRRTPQPRARGRSAFLVGVGIAGVELFTAFPYFASIALIVGAGVSLPGKTIALVTFNVLYVLPLIGITVVCAVMGSHAERVLAPFRRWALTRWPHVVAPAAVVLGGVVAGYGIARLA
ncbi:MAG TPA: GAP family protein [Thermoleophilaceae bacterium]